MVARARAAAVPILHVLTPRGFTLRAIVDAETPRAHARARQLPAATYTGLHALLSPPSPPTGVSESISHRRDNRTPALDDLLRAVLCTKSVYSVVCYYPYREVLCAPACRRHGWRRPRPSASRLTALVRERAAYGCMYRVVPPRLG